MRIEFTPPGGRAVWDDVVIPVLNDSPFVSLFAGAEGAARHSGNGVAWIHADDGSVLAVVQVRPDGTGIVWHG